ncbi:Class II abasic (AP) endonuclease [Salix suchowensis]|nr:Class II abasic (AP) endonuclease [Salix suchowensis]
MKSSRQALERSAALPSSYDAFFSFPTNKGGYSGVAVYTRKTNAVPLKVEEGLSGTLPAPKNIAVSKSVHKLAVNGSVINVGFGLFVLINLYCPNETSETRFPFKMNFHLMLEERVRQLTLVEGREVIVTGDINICAAPEDHCEGHIQSKPDRTGLPAEEDLSPEEVTCRNMWTTAGKALASGNTLHENGFDVGSIKTMAYLWTFSGTSGPIGKECWNTKIGARASNYGTRIDYFLVTRGLLPWIKSADISPEIKGSDHCPVWLELHDEIQVTDHNGRQRTLFLREMMQQTLDRTREPPGDTAQSLANPSSSGGIQGGESPSPTTSQNGSATSTSKQTPENSKIENRSQPGKAVEFLQPTYSRNFVSTSPRDTEEQIDADYQYALSLSQEPSQERASGKNSKAAWSNIMAPIKPPKCLVHGELATEYTACGPGYDKAEAKGIGRM